MADGEFESIRDDYYRAWFRFHPEAALDAGVNGYESRLRPFTDQDQIALFTLNEKLLGALDELDGSDLDPDQDMDVELMRGAALLEMEEILDFDWRHRDPEVYLPLHAIYQLVIRDTPNFAVALRSRVSGLPAYLRDARQYVARHPERIPPRWLESAMTGAEEGMGFLRDLAADPKVLAHAGELGGVRALIEAAVEAVRDYARFLETEVGGRAGGDFAVGGRRFLHLLRHRHFLPLDADELHAFGWRLYERTEREMQCVCRRLTGSDDTSVLDSRIRSDHPSASRLIADYREQMQAAKDHALSGGLFGFPASERLSVMETPAFLRHKIPFAAYEPASRTDPEQHGRYFVTPPRDARELEKHNRLSVMLTCVHEAYPGHHLQFATANLGRRSSTLPRVLNKSATLYEGWALYCEQLMFEQGFLDRPGHEYILLKDRLWRALRIVVDTGIHARGLSLEDAVQMMMDRLGFSRVQAIGELTWYSRAPTVPLGYAMGWSLVTAARRLTRADATEADLRTFHDRLLAQGSIALPLVLRQAFGGDLERRVLAELNTS